jgi:hypothetical protein
MKNKDILKSPDVYKPASGNLGSPVFIDKRGEIHRLEIGGSKLNILFSRKGVKRSGDLHSTAQYDFIFSGKVQIWYHKEGKDLKKIFGPNSFIEIPPYIPHLFVFLQNTLMAEWWDGEFKAWYFKPYRNIIEKN